MEELLPVLAAWLEDGPPLSAVLRAALAGEVAYLPLEEPPFEQTTHILEVHVVGAEAPFVLLAEPIGFATNGLFPLQVRPLDEAQRVQFAVTLAMVLVASARSLLKIGGPAEHQLVRERALGSAGILRKQLEALVQSGP